MMNKDLTEEELQELYAWIDKIKLSRPKRNISRDFSDGVMVSYGRVARAVGSKVMTVVGANGKHVQLLLEQGEQVQRKWHTQQFGVFSKLNFHVQEDVVKKIVLSNPGSIEPVLCTLRERLEEKRAERVSDGIQDLEYYSTLNEKQKTENHQVTLKNKAPVPVKKSQKSMPLIVPDQNVDPAFCLLLEEKEQALQALQETVEILQIKVNRLEHLVHLKDLRIEDLTKHLEKYKGRTNVP